MLRQLRSRKRYGIGQKHLNDWRVMKIYCARSFTFSWRKRQTCSRNCTAVWPTGTQKPWREPNSLKGELGYLGLTTASERARDLEQMGHTLNLAQASQSLTL